MKKESTSNNPYLIENFWFVTASKLKTFLTYGPEVYKLQYIDEIDVWYEEKRYFILWTAFDDLVSYWEEFFKNKYAIKFPFVKKELQEQMTKDGIEWHKDDKVVDLEAKYYWDKIKLSASEWDCLIWMYTEARRQPLADMNSEYKAQVQIEANYKSLKIKWTLDRISLEKKMIRDRKTSWNITYFEYNMDTTFDYILSMAFYYVLVKTKYDVSCDVVLDVLWKQKPYPYYWYMIDKQRLFDKVVSKIQPWLDALIECYETWIRESKYPLNYITEWKNWEIISHKKGDPISRTKLMQSWYYHLIDWGLQDQMIMPTL